MLKKLAAFGLTAALVLSPMAAFAQAAAPADTTAPAADAKPAAGKADEAEHTTHEEASHGEKEGDPACRSRGSQDIGIHTARAGAPKILTA